MLCSPAHRATWRSVAPGTPTPASNAGPDIQQITADTEVVILGVPAASLGFAGERVVASFAPVLAGAGYPGPYVPVEAPS